jgi:hypothetical protein
MATTMDLRNGYVILPDSQDPSTTLKGYLDDPANNIIYLILWGEDDTTKKAVGIADEIAEPGAAETGDFVYKVIYIPSGDILRGDLETIRSSMVPPTARDLRKLRGLTYSQAEKHAINVLLLSTPVKVLNIRRAFLYAQN